MLPSLRPCWNPSPPRFSPYHKKTHMFMGFLFLSVNRKPSIFRKLLLYHKCLEIESCTACTLPAAWWTRGHFCGGNAGCFWLTAGCSQNFFLPHCCLLRQGAGNSKPYFLLGKLTCGVKASGTGDTAASTHQRTSPQESTTVELERDCAPEQWHRLKIKLPCTLYDYSLSGK